MAYGPVNVPGADDKALGTVQGLAQAAKNAADTAASAIAAHKTASNPHGLTAAGLGAVPTSRTINGKALTGDITLTAANVSAVPTTRKVNGKALSGDITLTASDVSAVPTTRKVNGRALSGDITLTLADLGGIFYAGKTAPSDTKKLWIDTTATTGGLKYHNGSAWVHVPVSTT